jgi:hypothetical protein
MCHAMMKGNPLNMEFILFTKYYLDGKIKDEKSYASSMRKLENAYKILIRKPERKRPLRLPRHKWEDNIKMYLRAISIEGVDWIHLVQDKDSWPALINTVMNLRFDHWQGISWLS